MARDSNDNFNFDNFEDDEEYDAGEECGRWNNGALTRSCTQAGTEFCDFECPYRGSLFK